MPERDVLAAVGEGSERLLHRATDNTELCQRFMALVSMCALIVNERGARMDGVRIGDLDMTGRRMRAAVTFSRLAVPRSMPKVPEADSLVSFLHREAEGLWLFIRKNPDFLTFLRQVIEKMDAYARDKGREFENLAFENVFMDPQDFMVLELEA